MRQRLRQRFVTSGLTESANTDPDQNPEMLFKASGESVRLIVVDQTPWTNRQGVMDSMMRASASVGKTNKTYIALPKAAACVTDARLFQERGIGLLTYDHRNIEEALPARYFETIVDHEQVASKATALQVENELRELRAEFSVLERTVQHLKEELASPKRISLPSEPSQTLVQRNMMEDQVAADLPTFFAGNPWVELLSRRGRERGIVS